MYYETVTRAVRAGFCLQEDNRYWGRVFEGDFSSGTAAVWVVGQFDCGRFPGWKIDGPKRIFPG